MTRYATVALVMCISVGCGGGGKSARPVDPAVDDAPETILDGKADAATFAPGEYEQDPQYLQTGDLARGELEYFTVYAQNAYMRTRCLADGCQRATGEQGTLKPSRSGSTTYLRFYVGGKYVDRYAYEIDGDVLWMRRSGTSDWFPMKKVASLWSESLCDDTHGSWTDDDASPEGTFCVCGTGRVWIAESGCSPAASRLRSGAHVPRVRSALVLATPGRPGASAL